MGPARAEAVVCVPAEEGVLGRLAGKRLVAQGAEGQVFEVDGFLPGGATVGGDPGTRFLASTPGVGCILKRRFAKGYRHPDLDRRLTAARLRGEMRGLAPLGARVGATVARMHDGGLVHGDLTTSNLMVREGTAPGEAGGGAGAGAGAGAGSGAGSEIRLVVLDFGLAYLSTDVEDFAVDLYVLERAIASTHPREEGLFDAVLEAYRTHCSRFRAIISRFADVRLRGRKRAMVG